MQSVVFPTEFMPQFSFLQVKGGVPYISCTSAAWCSCGSLDMMAQALMLKASGQYVNIGSLSSLLVFFLSCHSVITSGPPCGLSLH